MLKMIQKKYVVVVACIIAVFFLGASVYAEDVIKIGSIYSISGPAAHLSNMALKGQQLAVEDINKAGGVSVGGKKYKIEAINYDDRCSAKDAVSIAERLINNDKVHVLISPTCSHANLAVMELNEKHKIPMITTLSASMKVTSMGHKFIFRLCPQAAMQAETVSRFAYEDLKLKKSAYIGRNDAWGKSVAEQLRKRTEARGGVQVATEFYDLGSKDFYSQLTKIKMANPEFIFPVLLAEDALLIKQAREIGIKCPIISCDELVNKKAVEIGGPALNGVYTYYYGGPTKPESLAYDKVFEKKYGVIGTNHSKLGYDGIMLVADAIKRAGSIDSIKIRDALADTKAFKGISGSYSFVPSGQAVSEMWIVQLQDGKAKFLKPIPIADNPPVPIDIE